MLDPRRRDFEGLKLTTTAEIVETSFAQTRITLYSK